MKQTDISPCRGCGKGVMHRGSPVFYRVAIATMAVDMPAVQRQAGLEQMLGGHAGIAFAMGRQEDMAKALDTTTGLVCLDCALTLPLAALLEDRENG